MSSAPSSFNKGVQIPPMINPVKWLIGLAEGLKKVNSSNIHIMIEKIAISFGLEERYRLYNRNNCAPSNPKYHQMPRHEYIHGA